MAAIAIAMPPNEAMFVAAAFPGGGVVLAAGGAVPDPVGALLPEVMDAVELEKIPLLVGTVPLGAPVVGTTRVTLLEGTGTTIVSLPEGPGMTIVSLPLGPGIMTMSLPEGMGIGTPVVGMMLVEPGITDVAGGAWIWPSLIWVMGRMLV